MNFTVRLLPKSLHSKTPRPVVLDKNLQLPIDAKLFKELANPESPHAKAPWILCAKTEPSAKGWKAREKRRLALEKAGARVIEVDMPDGEPLAWFTAMPVR